MPIEVEQKFPVADRDALLRIIGACDPVAQSSGKQVDTYYAHPARDYAKTDEALRLRNVNGMNFITYKGPKLDAKTKTRNEIELQLGPGKMTATLWDELLMALSFRRVAQVTKRRQIYELRRNGQAIEISVDQVQDVGDFVELEIVVPDEAAIYQAQSIIQALASELQLAGAERRSYLELLLGQ